MAGLSMNDGYKGTNCDMRNTLKETNKMEQHVVRRSGPVLTNDITESVSPRRGCRNALPCACNTKAKKAKKIIYSRDIFSIYKK